MLPEEKHKGYGFVTFSSPADAQDAIDNMDLNELRGKVLRVNLARPTKIPLQPQGNKASTCRSNICIDLCSDSVMLLVWESEEWLKRYAKPLAQSGGTCDHPPTHMSYLFLNCYVQVPLYGQKTERVLFLLRIQTQKATEMAMSRCRNRYEGVLAVLCYALRSTAYWTAAYVLVLSYPESVI